MTKKRLSCTIGSMLAVFACLLAPGFLYALTGLEVMKKIDDNNKNYKTLSSEVFMAISNEQKEKRERNFYNKKKYNGELSKALIKFYLPATVKGTSLLTHSIDGQTDNTQWIYLPALKSLNQIKGDKKRDSFMGSDFTYSDVAGRQLNQDEHTLVKEDEKYYYIRSVPKDPSDPYSKMNIIVSKKMPVPIKVTFYGKEGQKIKHLLNKNVKKIKDTYFVTESIMNNDITGGSTMLIISNIQIDTPISDNDVGIKGLKQ